MVIRKNKAAISYRVNPEFLNMFKNAASLAGLSKNAYAASIIESGVEKYFRYADIAPNALLQAKLWTDRNAHASTGPINLRVIRTDCILVPIEDAENLIQMSEKFRIPFSSVMKLLMLEDWYDLENTEWNLLTLNELAKLGSITRTDALRWAVLTGKKHPFGNLLNTSTEVSLKKKIPV